MSEAIITREAVGFRDAFLTQVESQPDATALIWHGQGTSYAELYDMALAGIDQIDALGLGADEPVGVLARKSPEAVALVLACLLTGRRFLLPSPALAERTLTMLYAQAACRYVLVPGEQPRPVPLGEGAPLLRLVDRTDVSFMLTTSGSTGLPKIVPLSQEAVDRFITWAGPAFGIRPGKVVLNYAPLNFDLCLLDIWTTLAHGGRIVLVDPDRGANGYHLLDLMIKHQVNFVQAVPMFYGLLLYAAQMRGARFKSVEYALFTGDAMPDCTLVGLPDIFPKARLYNLYGCTETNDSFIHEVDLDVVRSASADDSIGPLPIGTPLPGVHAAIVDVDGTVVTGPGMGELYVSTPFQATGYLDRTRHTGRFVTLPHGRDGRRYFRTGDLVRRDHSGQIYLVGRADFQVKVRGVAINTGEVEQVLLEHPHVLEAAVVAQPDDLAGAKLVSVVRRTEDSGLNSLVLREHLVQRLPQAAIPSVIQILDEPLPKTSTGKVDRKAVQSRQQVA